MTTNKQGEGSEGDADDVRGEFAGGGLGMCFLRRQQCLTWGLPVGYLAVMGCIFGYHSSGMGEFLVISGYRPGVLLVSERPMHRMPPP